MTFEFNDVEIVAGVYVGDLDSACRIRADERARIARELHDSTAQLLVTLQLRLMLLKGRVEGPGSIEIVSELSQLVSDLHGEIRSVAAHQLRAPFAGSFLQALREMGANFGQLTGMSVHLQASDTVDRLPADVQAALYRIAQEALANARRHAEAENVAIRIEPTPIGIRMAIEDDGIGLPRDACPGVGFASFRQRVKQLGGRLTIRRIARGTRLSISLLGRSDSQCGVGDDPQTRTRVIANSPLSRWS